MDIKDLPFVPGAPDGRIGALLHRIGDDVKTIASDELELIRDGLGHTVRVATADVGVIILGGCVALIGLSLGCVAAVVALEPVIPSLALRLVVMAIVYLIAGGGLAWAFGRRLRRDATPDLSVPKSEAARTIEDIDAAVHS
jgi:hypothetical protein